MFAINLTCTHALRMRSNKKYTRAYMHICVCTLETEGAETLRDGEGRKIMEKGTGHGSYRENKTAGRNESNVGDRGCMNCAFAFITLLCQSLVASFII